MPTRAALLLVVFAFLAFSFAGHAAEKKSSKDAPEAVVRLRLNAVEYAVLLDRYKTLLKREMDLKDGLKQLTGPAAARLEQPLKQTRSDLEAVRTQVLELEAERQKLLRALGKAPSSVPIERDRTLDKILDRLSSIENRLEKMGKSK